MLDRRIGAPLDVWAYNGFSASRPRAAAPTEPLTPPLGPLASPTREFRSRRRRRSPAVWRAILSGTGVAVVAVAAGLLTLPARDLQLIIRGVTPTRSAAGEVWPSRRGAGEAAALGQNQSQRAALGELTPAAADLTPETELAPPPPPAPLRPRATPVPRPAARSGCDRRPTAMRRLLCREPQVADLDRRLNEAYAMAVRSGAPAGRLADNEEAWVIQRDRVAEDSPEAVADLYRDRIARLHAFGAHGAPSAEEP